MSTRNPTTLMSIPAEDAFDFLFKIVLIGDCGTGKTCVVQRFKNGTFIERHGNTIGVDFSMKTVMVDGKKVKVQPEKTTVILILKFVIISVANMGYCRSRTFSYDNTKLLQISEWCYYRLRYNETFVVFISSPLGRGSKTVFRQFSFSGARW